MRRTLILLLLICAVTGHAAPEDGSKVFWAEFKSAVAKGDKDKIASMTKFPFYISGELDGDPVTTLTKDKFPAVLEKILAQQALQLSHGKVVSKTMRQIIKEKTRITGTDYAGANTFVIEMFVFEKLQGRWWFRRAYVEE